MSSKTNVGVIFSLGGKIGLTIKRVGTFETYIKSQSAFSAFC